MVVCLSCEFAGLGLVVLIFLGFWLKGLAESTRAVDATKDFVLRYQVSFVPTFVSIVGVLMGFGGALEALLGKEQLIGWLVCGLGVFGILYRVSVDRKYIFKQGVIACIRGGRLLGEFQLTEITRFVRIDYAGGVSLLGLETRSVAPSFMPSPIHARFPTPLLRPLGTENLQ